MGNTASTEHPGGSRGPDAPVAIPESGPHSGSADIRMDVVHPSFHP